MNHSDTRQYYVTTKCSMASDEIVVYLVFSPKDSNDDVDDSFTIRLTFELSIEVADLPKTFKIRNPFPRDTQQAGKHGKAMIREIKQNFEQGERRLLLHCQVSRSPSGLPDLSRLHARARTYIQYTLERSGTAFTTRSLPLSLSQVDIGNRQRHPRVWSISYDAVESIMFDKLCHYARFRSIQRALALYDVIAACGNRVVPRLNRKTKHALSLWLFKQGGAMLDDVHGAFMCLIQLVRGCVAGNFCPSFCQTQVLSLLLNTRCSY